jgi:hypothetical protein
MMQVWMPDEMGLRICKMYGKSAPKASNVFVFAYGTSICGKETLCKYKPTKTDNSEGARKVSWLLG